MSNADADARQEEQIRALTDALRDERRAFLRAMDAVFDMMLPAEEPEDQ